MCVYKDNTFRTVRYALEKYQQQKNSNKPI